MNNNFGRGRPMCLPLIKGEHMGSPLQSFLHVKKAYCVITTAERTTSSAAFNKPCSNTVCTRSPLLLAR